MHFDEMVVAVRSGQDPVMVVESASGPLGADRNDAANSYDAILSAFQQITGTIQSYNGYVGPDWITAIGEKLKGADAQGRAELVSLARTNRDQYVGSARIDCGGCWNMWDNILKGLLALQTDQLPPPPPSLTSRPELA